MEKVGTREEPRIRGRWTAFEGRLPRKSEKVKTTLLKTSYNNIIVIVIATMTKWSL